MGGLLINYRWLLITNWCSIITYRCVLIVGDDAYVSYHVQETGERTAGRVYPMTNVPGYNFMAAPFSASNADYELLTSAPSVFKFGIQLYINYVAFIVSLP